MYAVRHLQARPHPRPPPAQARPAQAPDPLHPLRQAPVLRLRPLLARQVLRPRRHQVHHRAAQAVAHREFGCLLLALGNMLVCQVLWYCELLVMPFLWLSIQTCCHAFVRMNKCKSDGICLISFLNFRVPTFMWICMYLRTKL